jgi:hypothetical protein
MNSFLCQLFYCNTWSLLVCICCCSSHLNLCHRFGRNNSNWLDSWWKVFISSHLPFLRRMHNCCLLLMMWFLFAISEPSSCDPCILITWLGQGLLYHTHFSFQGTVSGTCRHNKTTYSICLQGSQYACFDPQYSPNNEWLEVRRCNKKGHIIQKVQISNPKQQVSIQFDVCGTLQSHFTCM